MMAVRRFQTPTAAAYSITIRRLITRSRGAEPAL
jgi:hypothetical protein